MRAIAVAGRGGQGRWRRLLGILAATLAAATACGTSTSAGNNPPPPASGPSPESSAPAAPSPTPAADCGAGTWHEAPVTVTRQLAVPPVPLVTAVRTAEHRECGYDRIVLDITGRVPGYTIRYATRVTADPSGKPIALPGRRYLLVILRPARAHTGAGSATIARTVQLPGYRVMKAYALAGDFEGVLTLAIGLRDTASIRVGELPGRLYVDLRA